MLLGYPAGRTMHAGGTLPAKPRVVDRKEYWKAFGKRSMCPWVETSHDVCALSPSHFPLLVLASDEQVKQLSSSSTKMSVMFSKPPRPKMEVVQKRTYHSCTHVCAPCCLCNEARACLHVCLYLIWSPGGGLSGLRAGEVCRGSGVAAGQSAH